MKYLSFLVLLSCAESSVLFDREDFENVWWQLQEYPICFNFHESGDLLSYEEQVLEEGQWGRFVDEGRWVFCEPNEYSVEDRTVSIFESEDCWDIEGYYDNRTITACECTILQLDTN